MIWRLCHDERGTPAAARRAGRFELCGEVTFNDSAHRWRPIRNFRTTTWHCGAGIQCSAGFGRISVLGLPGRELKDALPRQPRTQSRYQHAGDEHPAHTGRNHNAEASNSHSGYKLLNSAASKHHLSSRYGSLPRPRSSLQRLPNAKVRDESQPLMTFDSSLSLAAGSRSLDRLLGFVVGL